MTNAYALGQYGYPKDPAMAAVWQRKFGMPNMIRF